MKTKQAVLFSVVACSFVIGCAGDGRVQADPEGGDTQANLASKADDVPTAPEAPTAPGPLSDPLRATVKETMDAGGYTYVRITTDGREVWAAARRFKVAVGDKVELAGLQLMRGFRSQSLKRVFEEIQFVGLAKVIGQDDATKVAEANAPAAELPAGHPSIGGNGEAPKVAEAKTPTPVLPSGHPAVTDGASAGPLDSEPLAAPKAGQIEKLADGVTVADLFLNRADLAGKSVKFRGRVVKVSRMILGSNWLHIQDGTGKPGSNDITVTSKNDFAPVGSVVVVQGTLALNKDFGAGYSYDVIVQDATVVPDKARQDEKVPSSASPTEKP